MLVDGRTHVVARVADCAVDDDQVTPELSVVDVVHVDGRAVLAPGIPGHGIRLAAHTRELHRFALLNREAGRRLLDDWLLSPCRRGCREEGGCGVDKS